MRVTARDGLRLHTVDFGRTVASGQGGPVLLAQGGWIGSWELWQQVFELLPGWRTIGFDHRGAGESPAHPAAITAEALVSDVFAVMDAHRIDRCVLAGESQGALVALMAVLERPERFDGLVLAGGMARYAVTDATRGFRAMLEADYDTALRAFTEQCAPDDVDGYHVRWGLDILRRAEPAAAHRLLEVLDGVDVSDRLPGLGLPSLVIHGSLDAMSPLADAEAMAGRLTDSELVVLDGVGHVPSFTQPVAVADAIRRRFPVQLRQDEPPTGVKLSSGP